MKKNILVICFFLFAAVQNCNALETSESQVEYWDKLVNENDFSEILLQIRKGPKYEWPKVVSSRYASKQSSAESLRQRKFREIAIQLTKKLEAYQERIPQMSFKKFCQSVDCLLILRDRIGKHQSYINLVLVETINEVLVVHLAKRLVEKNDDLETMKYYIQKLQSFRIFMQDVISMIEEEENKKLFDESRIQKLLPTILKLYTNKEAKQCVDDVLKTENKDLSEADLCRKIWFIIAPDSLIMAPKGLERCYNVYKLLQYRDFSVLLCRYVFLDFPIGLGLKYTAIYKEKVKTLSEKDTYQKIKQVLGEELSSQKTLGSDVWGGGPYPAAGAVSELLYDVRSGEMIDEALFFEPLVLDNEEYTDQKIKEIRKSGDTI